MFATLTFSREGVSGGLRERMFFRWLRECANGCRVPFRKLLWVRRAEEGEVGHRLHFHCLIGRLPKAKVHVGTCFQMMRFWEGQGAPAGFARVREFTSSTEGAEYLLKAIRGDDLYESKKFFGRSAELMLSRSCAEVVALGYQVKQRALQQMVADTSAV